MKPRVLERGPAAKPFLDSSMYPRPAAKLLSVQSGFLPGETEREERERALFLSDAHVSSWTSCNLLGPRKRESNALT